MSLLRDIDEKAITPAMKLLPAGMDTPRARVQMLCTGLQESGLTARRQVLDGGGKGAATGLAQFERGGGVKGVLTHPSTADLAARVCDARKVAPTMQRVWEELEHDDVLAMAFARLYLWTDPFKIPNDAAGGWQLYLRVWRPGKPHPAKWDGFYARSEAWVLRGTDS